MGGPFSRRSLELQVQRQLEETRASNRVLDHSEASRRRVLRRRRVVREKLDVVVGRVEVRLIENVERVEGEAQAEKLGPKECRLLSRCLHIPATLMQHEIRNAAFVVAEELDFRVHDSWEKLGIRLGKDRHLPLARHLGH